jgi:site-specific DNA recombinase
MRSRINLINKVGQRHAARFTPENHRRKGWEQAFNSLDAQREACAAFILSQKHEGWTVLPTLYDDGGFSGGTMERPALKRLIADMLSLARRIGNALIASSS